MTIDHRALDASTRYTIDGFDQPHTWRCLYASPSEAVFESVRVRLAVSTIDLTEIEPGRLRLERTP